MANGMRRMRVHIKSFGKPRISRPLGTSQFYLDISARPSNMAREHSRSIPTTLEFACCLRFLLGHPLHGMSSRRPSLWVAIRGLRPLVLDEKKGAWQVTAKAKRLSPEVYGLRITGRVSILELDS